MILRYLHRNSYRAATACNSYHGSTPDLCASLSPLLNRKELCTQVAVNNSNSAVSLEEYRQSSNGDPHANVIEDLRGHFLKARLLTNMGIVDALRKWYPNHTVTQTPKSTGLLKFAKAGQADATLDTDIDCYGSRICKPATDPARQSGRLEDKVELGRYSYRWKDRDFYVYLADYWEGEYVNVNNYYILYPRSHEDVKDGRSQMADELITAASRHLSDIEEEIWVYDRGYWTKNHKLWLNVQSCKWENVVLNEEMKIQLISDIEGFFDRKEDYASFAVPWKVRQTRSSKLLGSSVFWIPSITHHCPPHASQHYYFVFDLYNYYTTSCYCPVRPFLSTETHCGGN